jgi:nitrate/nitrite transporter NarK
MDPIARQRALASSRRLLMITLATLAVLLAVSVPVAWMVAGAGGAGSAALGVGLTGVLFAGGLLGLHRAVRGGSGGLGAILVAFSLRMVVYAAAFALASRAAWVHGPSLALATAASLVFMLAVELRAIAREPMAELEAGSTVVQVGTQDTDGPDDTVTTRRS